MKTLYKVLLAIAFGIFVAGGVSASLGEYWSTVSHLIPRTDVTVDIGSATKKVREIWTNKFYGDYWISATNNSMNVQPTGDTDDFFSFKTPADRPTIKREGGKYIYIQSSNVYDAGISIRDDATYSGTFAYEKDTHRMSLSAKNSPLIMKLNSDYDDFLLFQTTSNVPEITTVGAADLKINAGGANNLLLNHAGGNVGIGDATPAALLTVGDGDDFQVSSTGVVTFTGTGDIDLPANSVDEADLKAVNAPTDEYALTYESTTGDFEWQSVAGGGDITDVFDCTTGDCNTMTVGTSEYLTYGTGYIDANRFLGVTTVDATEFGYLNGLTAAIVQAGSASHDGFSDFVANEHLDWTQDLGATNIHTGNYTAGLTNLTDFDQTAWRLFYSNNLGDVIELSLGTNGEYLQSQGGTSSLTWSTPTDTTANETITLSGDVTGSGTTAITTTIGANKILESHLKSVNAATDEYCLTYEATTGDFEWQTCGGSLAINDITDITIDTPADNEVLAYNNGTSTWLNQTPAEAGLQGVLTNSAGLLAALNDETGTGVAVFGTSPTFTTGVNLPAGSIDTATEIANDVITHAQILDSDQVDTKCIYIESPTADDDFNSIWTANGFAATITKIWCESDQTVNMDLAVDDGTVADVNGTDLVCDSTPAEDESMGGDATLADGDRLDLLVTSVSGTPTWVSICWTYQFDD